MANLKLARQKIRVQAGDQIKVIVQVNGVEHEVSPMEYTVPADNQNPYIKDGIVLRADHVLDPKTDQELLDDGVIEEIPEDE